MPHTYNAIYAIGDIHGNRDALLRLLGRLGADPEQDLLVFMGDYINRGPDTQGVLDILVDVRSSHAHTVFLMGNHEHLLLEYAARPEVETLRTLRKMGIEATLASYGATVRDLPGLAFLPEAHRSFLQSLSLSHTCGPYLFVHADPEEADLSAAMEATSPLAPHESVLLDKALSSRRLIREHVPAEQSEAGENPENRENGEGVARDMDDTRLACMASGGERRLVVFAHAPFEMPLVMPDRICVDTGAVYGNLLTALELPVMRFHHA